MAEQILNRKPTEIPPPPEPVIKEKRKPVWPWFAAGAVVVGFTVLVLWRIYVPSSIVESDDARVAVHYTMVAPRVTGQVIAVPVEDNQNVQAGQTLMTLDPRDFETAIANAEAVLGRDQARVSGAAASVARQPVVIGQSQAALPAAQARLRLAELNVQRYRNLAATGAGTVQSRQQAEATLEEAQADLQGAQAALAAALQQTNVFKADQASAAAQVRGDRAMLDQARLNLGYTHILAALDGTVGQRSVQVGDYVSPGSPVMSVVPLQRVYVDANYREVALGHVLPGQYVRIHVDAYDIDLNGVVDSIAPASGATFSAIPPENATGNFTKIVQRLTVKILVVPGQPLAGLLRVGFNVETYIDTGLANVVGMQGRRSPGTVPVTSLPGNSVGSSTGSSFSGPSFSGTSLLGTSR